MDMNRKNCEECGVEFEYASFTFMGQEVMPPRWCDACAEVKRKQEQADFERKRASEAFLEVCPPLYRDTNPKKLPARFVEVVAKWEYGPKGIGFIGPPGKGKTRAAMLLLKKQIEMGRQAAYVTATGFGGMSASQFASDEEEREEAVTKMKRLRSAEILLFDDVGKGKMTERAEMEFYDLLEHRTSYMLPTIWTANSDGAQLRNMMSQDRGAAIIRRLMEFSEVV